ncbi:MAG: hypothetical protein EOP10_05890 [Proteobacteria bacterium]|nr:MAG: hypothetical protein EOP10_05890 [Pseudomonadota bacterium]
MPIPRNEQFGHYRGILMNFRASSISLVCFTLMLACSENTTFKGNPPSAALPPKAADVQPVPEATVLETTVSVDLSATEVRAGKKPVQATAIVKNSENQSVVWTVTGPEGVDLGTISTKGVYTSSETLKGEITVTIRATLASDSKIFGTQLLKVIPAESIFIGCSKGNEVFPIEAEVFRLPVDTQRLPEFDAIPNDKISIVCMDQFNVPERSFDDGFPGVENLNEWFALHTKGKLNISIAGDYQFRLRSDDGSMFYINGTTVVENNGLHQAEAREGSITLTAGVHDFVLDYYQGPANRIALELFWQVPGSSDFVIVPSNAFQK